ncbi:MAG: hypothetical protein WB558_06970 [Terriglobales bacterium]
MSAHKTFDKVTLLELQDEHRRIVWDDEGLIVEGQDVAKDIARQSRDYSEVVEFVNMPADMRERLKANRVSLEQIAASEYATKIYEGISRENPDGIDVPSLFVAAVVVKGTIDPPATWDSAERLIQNVNQHVLNLLRLWSEALGLDPTGEFEKLPKVPLGLRLKRGFPRSDDSPESPYGNSEQYTHIIEEQLKAVRSTREKYIVLDSVMSAMASLMGFGDELIAEVDRFIGDVSKPKVTGLVGVFGLE